MLHGLIGPTRRLTLGREAASKIDAAGADIAILTVDDRVAIPHRFPINEVHDAFPLALGLGAAERVAVTFGD